MTKGKKIVSYVFLCIVSFFSVFPIFWMTVSATNKSIDIIRGRLLPGTYLLENIKELIAIQNLGGAFLNSVKYSTILTIISLAICSLAGYGFEIYHDKAKDVIMGIILLAMMIPFVATLIPLFQLFSSAGLMNTTLGFILPTISTPFLIMMFRQNARAFPRDIIEASRIDGLSEIGIFIRMFVPIMRPTYAAAMTITFMNSWNSYLWPKVIMTSDDSITMPMVVANVTGGYVTDYGVLMVAILICTLPTALIFFFLQKYFTEGITGAVK